jgi:membrane-bound lytic murein transglycosylase D
MPRCWWQRQRLSWALLCSVLAAAGCSSTIRSSPSVAPSTPASTDNATQPSGQETASAVDPIGALIATSDAHFEAGQQALGLGHVDAARAEFDLAVNVLLESPYGGRTEPRIRDHFDRLIDRISAFEIKALAEGDGFTEKTYEAASIDDLLAISTFAEPPDSSPELKEAVASDLEHIAHDVPIPLNGKVLSYISLFQGRLRDFIQEGMSRGAKYLPMIQNVLRAEGLPLDLAYVPLIESAFKPNALSRARAKGVWQFVRGTGLEYGLRQDWYVDERSDPEKSTLAAAKYLATLSGMFDGDWHLALASYNGGPGRVQRAMKRGRSDDFWSLAAKRGILPRETREYVPMILAAIVVAKNPQQYGFEFNAAEETAKHDTVTLPGPIDLRRVAEWAGTTIDVIRELNPELRRWTTPVRDNDYELKVPPGTAVLVSARLAETVPTELATFNYYSVKRGETMTTIARKLKVNRADLADANYLKVASRLSVGQQLLVPRETTVMMAARTEVAAPVAESTAPDRVVAAVGTPAEPAADRDLVKTSYRVRRGDTLSSIAREYNTTIASLQRWNRITGTQIRAGQRLTIYTARAN